MVSPLVLSTLARHKSIPDQSDKSRPEQVTSLLQQEAQKAQQEAPHISGFLGQLLNAF